MYICNPPVAAHHIMRFMTILHTDVYEVIDLMEDVRVDLKGKFVRKHLANLAAAILSSLPAYKPFCLAARRQNIVDLASFIGYRNVYWVGWVCAEILIALDESRECLTRLEDLRHASFIQQSRPVLRLHKQLWFVRRGLFEMTRLWLSQRKDLVPDPLQSFSWETVFNTAADALEHITRQDPSWFAIRCKLVGWGNGQFDTKLTLDEVMKDEEAWQNCHGRLIRGFTTILSYGGAYLCIASMTVLTHI